eukprot:jgi/Psemu1/195725/e_gw1.177.48.1
MLDMGGAPSSNNDQSLIRTVNASKNSKVQAVVFDFKALINTNANSNANTNGAAAKGTTKDAATDTAAAATKTVSADNANRPQVAELLNVDFGSSNNNGIAKHQTPGFATKKAPAALRDHRPGDNDVRAKYAAKLKGKGGLDGIELAKSQATNALTKGDAAGHLAARKIAVMGHSDANDEGSAASGASKWLPSQGASTLLTLLTHRSIRICLLPMLSASATAKGGDKEEEGQPRMEDFKTQLKNVIIDKLISEFHGGNNTGVIDDGTIEKALKIEFLNELNLDPNRVLLVSDRDQYLRVGRDLGMNICRIRPKNARRGNITAHYTVESVDEVQDVVNEINGISFNVVLNR